MSGSDDAIVLVLCTVPDEASGERIARGLLERRLAACVSRISDVCSTYRWRGAIEVTSEVQLVIKTTKRALDRVAEFVSKEHPYEVPELLAVLADGLLEPYARWIREEVAGAASDTER